MSIVKVTMPTGMTMELESIEDAAKLYSLIVAEKKPGPYGKRRVKIEEENGQLNQDESVNAFFKALAPEAMKIVKSLADFPDAGLTTDELAVKTGVGSPTFPPIIRSIRKTAERCGFKGEVLEREKFNEGGKPKSRYRLSKEIIESIILYAAKNV